MRKACLIIGMVQSQVYSTALTLPIYGISIVMKAVGERRISTSFALGFAYVVSDRIGACI